MTGLLTEPFQAAFMQRALLAVLVLGVLAGAVGVFVVLRRLAFVGDALTHTVFPGVVIAFLIGQSVFLGALTAALLSALLLTALTSTRRVTQDAGLAILLTSFFAVGVVLVSREQSYTSDLSAFLFGRILAVDWAVLIQTLAVSSIVLTTLVALRKELLLRAFDPDGVATMTAISCGLVAVGGWLGLAISYDVSLERGVRLASGATMVVVLVAGFVIALAVRPARRALARVVGGAPAASSPRGAG